MKLMNKVFVILLILFITNVNSNQSITLGEAIENARRIVPGKVISAETIRIDQKEIHHIRILTRDGKVKRYRFNGKNGQLINNRR